MTCKKKKAQRFHYNRLESIRCCRYLTVAGTEAGREVGTVVGTIVGALVGSSWYVNRHSDWYSS